MIDATGQQEHERDAAPAPTIATSPEPVKDDLADNHAPSSHSEQTRPHLKVKGLISPELASAVRVCIRSYGVGYVFATAPKLIKTVLVFLLNPRKATPKGQSPVAAFLRTILAAIKNGTSSKRDGMSMLLMISLGGYKLLELFLDRGMKKAILAQRLQEQQQQDRQDQRNQHGDPSSSTDSDQNAKWTRNDADKIELPADLKQRVTMMASFLSSAAAIVFMHRHRPNHATIDYSLFAVVRGLDVFGHVAVKNQWGPSWMGPYGAVAVFVLACTEIMFSWLYEPERLPGPYAFWITKMGRMDKRLLETLRGVRAGTITFGQPNPPEVSKLLIGLCEDIGIDPRLGDFELNQYLPCKVVHQGIADSCEAHSGYRWIQGFLVSAGIYLPVHLLPVLLSPKAFFKKLEANPVSTAASTLLSTARSSAFLATYISMTWYGICFWRSRIMPLFMKLSGRQYTSNVVDQIWGPLLGSFLCGFSVLIEKPHRRAEMALYALPRAMYSMWSRVMSGRLSRRVEMTGETLMYAISMSALLTGMVWKRDMVRPSMQGLLGWMLEIPRTKDHGSHHHREKGKAHAVEGSRSTAAVVEDRDALAAVERARSEST